MKKHLYEIKRLDIPAYLKWWFIKYRNAGTLSEVLENLTSPITLTNSLKRKFKIFEIGGKSEQETTDGRQLFDGNNPSGVNMATSKLENDILTISSESTETIPFVRFFENYEVSPNDIIRLNVIILDANGQIVVQEYINSQWLTISSLTRNYIDGKTISEISRTISENATAIRFLFYSNNSKPTQSTSSRYKNIIVTKNNSNMEYERYTGGQPAPNPSYECPIQNVTGNVEVKVENGNLFDVGIDNSDYVTNSDTLPKYLTVNDKQLALVIQANGSTCVYRKQNFQGNKDYSFKAISSKASGRIYIRIRSLDNTRWLTDSDLNIAGFTYNMYYKGWFLQVASTNMIKAFSIPECLYWQFGLGFSSEDVGTTQIISNIQLVEGTYTTETMPDYIPHEEQTAIFPLEEGQILHEGDTIEDKIVQRRKTLVLDGTENWIVYTGISNTFTLRISNILGGIGLCSHFKFIDSGLGSNDYACLTNNSGVFIKDKDISTLADFKAYLAQQYANSTPVTLEYELAEPIEIPFTEAQATAKANIDKLYSYKGTTYISSTNDPSPLFTIQYVKEET